MNNKESQPVIQTTIYIEPVGKGRPRFARRGNRVFTYTPQKTAHAESRIQEAVMKLGIYYPKETPLILTATFYREKPKSLPKRVTMPVARPDWDNYGKLISDALEKFVYANDSQITTAVIKKRFGSPPRIELNIKSDNMGE